MRGDKNKKKVKQADFPAKMPESSPDKCETDDAEQCVHDLSPESRKGWFLIEIREPFDRAKNDSGGDQAEKHSLAVPDVEATLKNRAGGNTPSKLHFVSTVTTEPSSRKNAIKRRRGKSNRSLA